MNNLEMPSIKDLFKESWKAFVGSLGNVFILSLMGSALGILFFVLVFLGIAGAGVLSVVNEAVIDKTKIVETVTSFLTPERTLQLGIAAFVMVLIAGIISTALKLAVVFTIGNYKERPKIGTAIFKGFSMFFPVLVMGIVTSAIIFGGMMVLVIPGIIIGILFSFVGYELILGEKKWFSALKAVFK